MLAWHGEVFLTGECGRFFEKEQYIGPAAVYTQHKFLG